jgi:putative transcriptional regulator
VSDPFAPSTKGRLLVATPPLGDPNFDRTVVYVLDHHPGGAVGVVLNRPTSEDELDGLHDWIEAATEPRSVFTGGPVELDALIALGVAHGHVDGAWGDLTNGIGTVDLSLDVDEVAASIDRLRIFRGYAGWGAGQLDDEIAMGAWMVFDAEPDDIFTDAPDDLWRQVVRRQGGRLRWIADAPDDLSAN